MESVSNHVKAFAVAFGIGHLFDDELDTMQKVCRLQEAFETRADTPQHHMTVAMLLSNVAFVQAAATLEVTPECTKPAARRYRTIGISANVLLQLASMVPMLLPNFPQVGVCLQRIMVLNC